MDLEGEKLDEDIHQIQLVLQSSHQQGKTPICQHNMLTLFNF